MRNRRILISGAGVAGLALAYWLRRYGFEPTVIERAPRLRCGGYKVDIRGVAIDVVERMGLHDEMRAAHTDVRGATIIDERGRSVTELNGDTFNYRCERDMELMRGDLCQILLGALDEPPIRYGDSIGAVAHEAGSVRVEFEEGPAESFNLVVGADGLHSRVRGLVFGEESKFTRELGMYLGIFSVPNTFELDRWELEFCRGEKLVNIYSTRGQEDARAAFLFRSKPLGFSPRDKVEQQELLRAAYAGLGWKVPQLLEAMPKAPDFYFDAIAQICMDRWFQGRVALVGDAGYCASPVSGQGTSLALVGAYVLAGELARAEGHHLEAFSRYQKEMRGFVKANQQLGRHIAASMNGEPSGVWASIRRLCARILPGQSSRFEAESATRRVSRAANAITLPSYASFASLTPH